MAKAALLSLAFILYVSSCLAQAETPSMSSISVKAAPLSDDSIEQLWLEGKVFWTTIVRLAEGRPYFIDAEQYADSSLDYLDTASREQYYATVRQKIKPDELSAHLRVWALPEVMHQQGGDGGMYTVFTNTEDTPTAQKPVYTISIKRLYIQREGRVLTLPMYIKVNVVTGRLTACNSLGQCKHIEAWRRRGFKED